MAWPQSLRAHCDATTGKRKRVGSIVALDGAYLGALALGLRALSPAIASLRVAWQGVFGADRTRGSMAEYLGGGGGRPR